MGRIHNLLNSAIIILSCILVSMGPGKLWGQQSHSSAELPSSAVLTQIRDILQLSDKDADRGPPVRVRGVVTYYDGPAYHPDHSDPDFFLQDSTGGIFVKEASGQELNLTAGDFVELKGVTAHGWYRNQIEKPSVSVLGRAPLPEPRRPATSQLELGRVDCEWVKIAGMVYSAEIEEPSRKLILHLSVGARRVKVTVLKYPKTAVTGLLDSNVQIQGVCGGEYNHKREMTGIIIYVPDISFVHNLGASAHTEGPARNSVSELERLRGVLLPSSASALGK
ncbi:MAG: hypothetical protein WAO35_02720 [Terriglobia bacterium]